MRTRTDTHRHTHTDTHKHTHRHTRRHTHTRRDTRRHTRTGPCMSGLTRNPSIRALCELSSAPPAERIDGCCYYTHYCHSCSWPIGCALGRTISHQEMNAALMPSTATFQSLHHGGCRTNAVGSSQHPATARPCGAGGARERLHSGRAAGSWGPASVSLMHQYALDGDGKWISYRRF